MLEDVGTAVTSPHQKGSSGVLTTILQPRKKQGKPKEQLQVHVLASADAPLQGCDKDGDSRRDGGERKEIRVPPHKDPDGFELSLI